MYTSDVCNFLYIGLFKFKYICFFGYQSDICETQRTNTFAKKGMAYYHITLVSFKISKNYKCDKSKWP